MSSASVDELAELRSLAQRALHAGTARFRLVDAMVGLGSEPPRVQVGLVDFRRRSFDAGAQRLIDGVIYARHEDGVWTRLELGSREPVGPAWMLDLLTDATSATAIAQDLAPQTGARSVEGVADVFAASKVTGRRLEYAVGGGRRRSSLRAIRVSAIIAADGLPRRVTADLPDLSLTCEFWDYGTEEPITAPAGAVSLGPSFVRSMLRELVGRKRRRST